jgi:hypothetical protein
VRLRVIVRLLTRSWKYWRKLNEKFNRHLLVQVK